MGPHAPRPAQHPTPGERFVWRGENEWPIARTKWTRYHLHPDLTLRLEPPDAEAEVPYDALGDGLVFRTEPFAEETEITGPMSARLFVSSSTRDADLFLIVQLFDPAGEEVTFEGSTDPNTPIANGWLRHRTGRSTRSGPGPGSRTTPTTAPSRSLPARWSSWRSRSSPPASSSLPVTGSGCGCGAGTTSTGAASMITASASSTPPAAPGG